MATLRVGLVSVSRLVVVLGLVAGARAQTPAAESPVVVGQKPAAAAQVPATTAQPFPEAPAPVNSDVDILIFNDGDRASGEFVRIERGNVVFRSYKTGEANIDFSYIKDLRTNRRWAILKKGVRVRKSNAIIAHIELQGDSLLIKPDNGSPAFAMKAEDVAFAIDDVTFEKEIARKVNLHEGWSVSGSIGGELVRSTEEGGELRTDFSLSRTVPGVDYLPRRSRSSINVRDSYEVLTTPNVFGEGEPYTAESHIFHADAEHNEYLHSHVFALAKYSFDRNFAQGLTSQELYGAGLGWTVIESYLQELDIKTDFHREIQAFSVGEDNDVIYGQTYAVEYQRQLPGNLTFRNSSNYLSSYNFPHKYSANSASVLTIPLFWRIGVSLELEDNYLNNPVAGLKRNTLRFATSFTYYH